MLGFSTDPTVHEQEMQAVIWYLIAVSFLDGHFDVAEREAVRAQVVSLVEQRSRAIVGDDLAPHGEAITRWVTHFHESVDTAAAEVGGYFTESPAEGEDIHPFVTARLKLRCFELFQGFSPADQEELLRAADAVIEADGVVHPAEKAFRDELAKLLHDAPEVIDEGEVELVDESVMRIVPARPLVPRIEDHPFLRAVEREWSRDPKHFAEESEHDLRLIRMVMDLLDKKRDAGRGKLAGHQSVAEFAPGTSFLDGHTHVFVPPAEGHVDLLVIGDLHGCYSCLKAALLQADFFQRVEAHHADPAKNPPMKLVLLGDYIDRGKFSYSGVLRAAMRIMMVAPDDVYVLRGNHEYYIEHKGKVLAPVRPAEAMTSLEHIAPQEVFAAYMRLFEALPNTLLFDKTMFVHAGIPRDDIFAERWKDLASLNDPDMRFQMLWSDPSQADTVPASLQAANARFGFGRKQFQKFMSAVGTRALVRGHEKVDDGFRLVYDDPNATLMTLFSSGGAHNDDLPPDSSYRSVTPMALTIRHENGVSHVTPFTIDYQRFNDPKLNAFFEG